MSRVLSAQRFALLRALLGRPQSCGQVARRLGWDGWRVRRALERAVAAGQVEAAGSLYRLTYAGDVARAQAEVRLLARRIGWAA